MNRWHKLIITLLFCLVIAGCGTVSSTEKTELEKPSELPTSAEELHRDYTGEFPSDEELRDFFASYCNEFEKYYKAEEVQYCGHSGNYVIVLFPGMGAKIALYEFECSGGYIRIIGKAGGDIALSGGLSINHTEKDGRHIYFGTCSDYHWDSNEEVTFPIEWFILTMTDEQGNVSTMDMSEKLGYLCVLDAPLVDFQVIDQGGNVCLDYTAYLEQRYIIIEAKLRSLCNK